MPLSRQDVDSAYAQFNLTSREREIVWYATQCYTEVEVATTLGISPDTVRRHSSNVHEKTGRANKLELVHHAYEHKLEQLQAITPLTGMGVTCPKHNTGFTSYAQ